VTTEFLRLTAPAKLNLFLHITGQRTDGYHNLQTVFQLLDFGDTLSLRHRSDGGIHLSCDLSDLADDNNLVVRAAKALQQRYQCPSGADIELIKRIPAGAGLGGGSSDAATTLLGLNQLWQLELSRTELAKIGRALGADVPVFVHGHSAWAEGIGDILTPIDLPHRYFVVLTPACHISTGRIFSHEQLTRDSPAIKIRAFLAGQSHNDCEPLVRKLYPQVGAVLDWLSAHAPARLTGTGASVFAAFECKEDAAHVLSLAMSSPEAALAEVSGFIARGVNQSVVVDQLIATQADNT
jgi:4-diphosphocytidyl-2-C-methyl-D-erythritol kinase